MTAKPARGEDKKKRVRSPNFPAIDLEDAVKRAKEFYDREDRHWANIEVASRHWGYASPASGGALVVAALIGFGLMDDEGSRDTRKVRLSDSGLRIVLDSRPNSPDRIALLQKAALLPKVYADIWQRYGCALPSDENLEYFLLSDMGFNRKAVPRFIEHFRHTIAFASLLNAGKIGPKEEDAVIAAFGLQQDRSSESALGETGATNVNLKVKAQISSKPGMNQDVWTLPGGRPLVLNWPEDMTTDDIEEVEGWLDMMKKKLKRVVTRKEILESE